MSFRNRVGGNIEAAKLEPEVKIEMKLDELKDDHTKTINPTDMKISAITTKNPY